MPVHALPHALPHAPDPTSVPHCSHLCPISVPFLSHSWWAAPISGSSSLAQCGTSGSERGERQKAREEQGKGGAREGERAQARAGESVRRNKRGKHHTESLETWSCLCMALVMRSRFWCFVSGVNPGFTGSARTRTASREGQRRGHGVKRSQKEAKEEPKGG